MGHPRMWDTRLRGEVVLDLFGDGAGVFAGGSEGESFLEVLLGGGAVIVMEVSAGKGEVGFGAGIDANCGDGLIAGFSKPALQD
jgi:hypothetical protein